MKLEFFFDCSSPWTYLAFEGIQPIAERHGIAIDWRPILVGGVFNAVNQEVYAARANPNPRRWQYTMKDLADWARYYGLEIGWPAVFPVNSVKAMRGALVALDEGRLVPWARAVFQRYWRDLADISQPEVVAEIAAACGFDTKSFMERIEQPGGQGAPAPQHRGTRGARRLRHADHVPGRRRHVLRQRPAGAAGAGAHDPPCVLMR